MTKRILTTKLITLAAMVQVSCGAAHAGSPARAVPVATSTRVASMAVVPAVALHSITMPVMRERHFGPLTRQGMLMLTGPPALIDSHRAGDLFRAACKAGDAVGCRKMAELYQQGTALIVRDTERAAELFAQACSGGDEVGCTRTDSRAARASLVR